MPRDSVGGAPRSRSGSTAPRRVGASIARTDGDIPSCPTKRSTSSATPNRVTQSGWATGGRSPRRTDGVRHCDRDRPPRWGSMGRFSDDVRRGNGEDHPIPAGPLGLVERLVCPSHRAGQILGGVRERHAEAGRHAQVAAGRADRCFGAGSGPAQSIGPMDGSVGTTGRALCAPGEAEPNARPARSGEQRDVGVGRPGQEVGRPTDRLGAVDEAALGEPEHVHGHPAGRQLHAHLDRQIEELTD